MNNACANCTHPHSEHPREGNNLAEYRWPCRHTETMASTGMGTAIQVCGCRNFADSGQPWELPASARAMAATDYNS